MSASYNERFSRDGYLVVRRMFRPDEVDRLGGHFMALRRRGAYPHDLVGVEPSSRDPLRRYPRMAQTHRWDDTTLRWLLDDRISTTLTGLLGTEPFAVQSMLYFKPPGSRGQAPHQDNFYLRAEPGTCVAAWKALDAADEENGCLAVIPGSHRWPILCIRKADTNQLHRRHSASSGRVPAPTDPDGPRRRAVLPRFTGTRQRTQQQPRPVPPGPHRALRARWARQVAEYYHPALRMDGTPLHLEVSGGGGPCGEWIEQEGVAAIAMTGQHAQSRKHE